MEKEVEKMAELLLSNSVSLGRMGTGWAGPSLSVLPQSSLSLSPSSLTSWSRQCVSEASGSLVSSAAHDAAVISVDAGSISFTASSITSITCAITSAHFPDGAAFSVSGWLADASVAWLGSTTSAETVS